MCPRRPQPGRSPGPPPSPDYLRALVERGDDPAFWTTIRDEELPLLAYQLALYFGLQRDADTASALSGLYARVVERVSVDDRMELCDHVTESVRGGASSALALLPFLQRERDATVAQAAATAFATLLPATQEIPLAGPRMVRTLLDHTDEDAIRLGLVGALLSLGDRRVLPLLRGSWRALSPASRDALLAAPPPLVTALLVEFLLDWLEDADVAASAAIAATLSRLPTQGAGRVLDLERRLPEREGEEVEVLAEWSAADYGAQLAPRLRDLARRVDEPASLAAVLAAWGVSDGD